MAATPRGTPSSLHLEPRKGCGSHCARTLRAGGLPCRLSRVRGTSGARCGPVRRVRGRSRSRGVSIQPARILAPSVYALAGSSQTPEGDPNITTACRASEPSMTAIHLPAQSNEAGSAIGTSPRLRSANPAGRTGAARNRRRLPVFESQAARQGSSGARRRASCPDRRPVNPAHRGRVAAVRQCSECPLSAED